MSLNSIWPSTVLRLPSESPGDTIISELLPSPSWSAIVALIKFTLRLLVSVSQPFQLNFVTAEPP